ncbi:hypothetical protein BMF94_0952 [Rhodotorula taiwanensis]|uniref:Uncharacterized protein n=1 Tax=Rhodotorula taiwanensis TaxID=741276 RepID=A0A2S5BGH3_9BASI|nr:hypothetical protein BMF94_0952 [Rhodotorula taiwanensis]
MPRKPASATATSIEPRKSPRTASSNSITGKAPADVPALRSASWTSAAHLGSLFSSPSGKGIVADDTASTLSSSSSSVDLIDLASSSSSIASLRPPSTQQESAYDLHSTPIPAGALVLLDGKPSASSDVMPNPSNRSPAAVKTSAPVPPTSRMNGRQTRVWSGPKGKMPFWQRWRIWYGGVSVIQMLEPWECVLYHSIMLVALFAVFCALAYLPAHASVIVKRVQWYISGIDA